MARILNEETIAANKRKREAADHGKSTPKKSKLKHKGKPESSVLQTPISTQRQNAEMTAGTPLVPASTKSKKDSKRLARALQKGNAYRGTSDLPVWKVSEPIGGRMLDIDAVLTDDEQHLILAYNASIQVYSSANSLLVRKIAINFPTKTIGHETVVAMRLSPTDPDYVWVASSAGRIWKINWTTGEGAEAYLKIKCDYVSDLEVDAVSLEGQVQDVILVSLSSSGQWHILACDIRGLELKATRPVVQRREVIQHLQFLQGGQVLAASSGKDLILGTLSGLVSSFQQLAYEVFILDCSDEISCMDLRATDRVHLTRQSQIEMGDDAVIEVVVGCARGSIFYYNDIVPQLRRLHASGGHKRPIQPRKLHWHRKAVHAVKWSRDGTLFTLHLYFQANRAGHYIISGGSESVLIQWQLDTGKKDPLPHLAGTIENIVVSARGSSYVIHLDDNSTMILSTAENKPTTYISGVQTLVTPPPPSKDSIVRRVGAKNLRTALSRVPAAVDPQDPTHLLLGVSNSQQINDTGVATAMPLLQTVDITTVQGISKQALARTHPTDVNITPKGFPLTEPRVTHLANSRDGRWLATIDEWQPPARDVENLEGPPAERREVHLKFWMPNKDGSSFELVSRINAPHYTGRSERVFDLAADPTCHRFATIGEDGIVRLWQPVIRQRDGIVVKSQSGRQLEHWACSQSTQLYENEAAVGFQGPALPRSLSRSGAVSFSEDGSTVACAFQNGGGSAIFIIDADSGAVVKSINGLTRGEIQGISVLSSQVVLLSEDLVVHNIVLDELSFGISLRLEAGKSEATPILPQLAVDHASGTFATAVSRCDKHGATTSELAIFSPDQSQPAVVHKFPYPIVSLITSPSSTGYMILDAAAQLWSVSHTTNTSSIGLAQPLANIKLDQVEPAQEDHPISLAVMDPMVTEDEEPSDDEMELDAPDTEADDDVHPVVVAPQKLAELFDAAPAFAMPPVEDMFYQVAKLFSTKNSAGVA